MPKSPIKQYAFFSPQTHFCKVTGRTAIKPVIFKEFVRQFFSIFSRSPPGLQTISQRSHLLVSTTVQGKQTLALAPCYLPRQACLPKAASTTNAVVLLSNK